MHVFLMLLVLGMVMFVADGNPDNGAGDAQGDANGGDDGSSIKSLDEVSTDDDPGAGDSARSDATEKSGDQKATELILGKFKTPEEAFAAYTELEKQNHAITMENANLKKPAAAVAEPDEWVELSEEQLSALQETDPEAHKWYVTEKADRDLNAKIDAKLKPLNDKVAPIDQIQKEKMAANYYANEEAILAESKKNFGDEFESLDKQRQDVAFLQKVFPTIPKPLADAILQHNKSGSEEYARQLLLGQIQTYNIKQARLKSSRSVNPDIGSPSGKAGSKESASSIEEAAEASFQELGLK